MSFSRLFRWTCDICSKEEYKSDYGFPKGWTWFVWKTDKPLDPLKHTCNTCLPIYAKDFANKAR